MKQQQELSYISDGNAKKCSHFRRWFDGFLKNETYSYHTIQQSHSLVFTQESWKHMSTRNLNMDVYSSFSHNCQNLEAIRLTLTSLNTFALRSFIFFYATRLPLTLNFSLLTVKTDLLSAYSVMDFSTPDIPHHFVLFLCLTSKCPTLHQFLLTSFSERSCCRCPCSEPVGHLIKHCL